MIQDILDLRFAFLSAAVMAGEEVDEEDDDEEESEEDDGDEGAGKGTKADKEDPKDPRVKAANDEAKRYRLRAKALAKQLREKEREAEEKAEKDKPEIDRLKAQVTRLEKRLANHDDALIRVAVLERALEHGIDGEQVDFFEYKLKKTGHLHLDEDGDFPEELEEAAKNLAAEISGTAKVAGGGRDAQKEEEDDDEPAARRLPKSPNLSGKKNSKKDTDLAALRAKYPALANRG